MFSLIAIGACGGNVIVEDTTGAGGSGASSPTGSGASGVGGADPDSTCTKLCAIGDAFNCDTGGGDCVSGCVAAFDTIPTDCHDEYADVLDCAAASIPEAGCDLSEACIEQIFALSACIDSGPVGCGDAECGFGETSCSCKGFCEGQSRAVECSLAGNQYACTCYLEGQQVGSCSEPFQDSACDLAFGCCSAFF